MKQLTTTLALLALAAAAHAQAPEPAPFIKLEIEVKGLVLGAPMSACPEGWQTIPNGAVTRCTSANETLGGAPVKGFELQLFDGKLGSFVAMGIPTESMPAITEAFTAKYGRPSVSKPHISEYAWVRGDSRLSTQGHLKGAVVGIHVPTYTAQKAHAAGKAGGDI